MSEAFVRFFVELVGHYSLSMTVTERGERVFQREPFRKSHTSRSVRHFLDLFMETQMFAGFIQDRELRKSGVKGQFHHKVVTVFSELLEGLKMIPTKISVKLQGLKFQVVMGNVYFVLLFSCGSTLLVSTEFYLIGSQS